MKHQANKRQTSSRQILSMLLLVIYFAYGVSTTRFMHMHIQQGMMIVVHAHPFQSDSNDTSPFQKHTHSQNAFWFLGQVSGNNSINLSESSLIFDINTFCVDILYLNLNEAVYSQNTDGCILLRAPPQSPILS